MHISPAAKESAIDLLGKRPIPDENRGRIGGRIENQRKINEEVASPQRFEIHQTLPRNSAMTHAKGRIPWKLAT
jgi:hypothetical protein